MRRHVLIAVLAAVAAAVTALPAAARPGPEYAFDPDRIIRSAGGFVSADAFDAAIEQALGEPVETVSGSIAGAAYVGQRPADWNGDLVVWAHGFRGEGAFLYVDPPAEVRWLLDQGYAWIASSYRRNSYDPGVGVLDTKNVTNRAARLWGQPEHTYVAGVSMGGHVIAAAIEQYPNLFDGALPACGVLGDVELFDYFLDYNLGAAAFAGLDPSTISYPDADWVKDEVVEIKQALSTYDEVGAPITRWAADGVFGPDLLAGPGDDFKAFVGEGSGSADRVTYDVAWAYWHLLADPTGNFFFDLGEGDGTIANRPGVVAQNVDTDYSTEYGSFTTAGGEPIDQAIVRVEASNRVRNAQGVKPAPIIRGTPRIPVLTIHTIGDLFVPIEMEQIYALEVAANGRSDLLVQRAIRDVGHCTFSPGEWQQSYMDLFRWVEEGVHPEGDDLVADIDDPLLGCEWTIDDGAPSTAVRGPFPCP